MMRRNDEAGPSAPAGEEGIEGAGTKLLEHHAFLLRWGTSEEIDSRIAELHRIRSWWASKEVPADEDDAGSALRKALDRLTTLRRAVQAVQTSLHEGGYEFDAHLRVLRERRQPAVDEDVTRERAHGLLSETFVDIYEHMKKQGRPDENTPVIRTEIRGRLARSLHPELLSDGAIKAALDEGTIRATDPPTHAQP